MQSMMHKNTTPATNNMANDSHKVKN